MKRVKPAVAVVWVAGATLLTALFLWVPGGIAGEGSQAHRDPSAVTGPKHGSANSEPPMSIFNDKLRRFKFRIERSDVVTVQGATAFMERYAARGNPEIIGAYPDADANLLVVIGPPEAEQAIRRSLATDIIEMQGIDPYPSLKIQKRILQSQGRELIRDMAQIEVVKVKIAATNDENRDKNVKRLDLQLQSLGAELDFVERQIQVVDKYL